MLSSECLSISTFYIHYFFRLLNIQEILWLTIFLSVDMIYYWLLILYLYFPVLYLHECISCGMDISHKIRAAVCDQFLDSCRTITFPGLSYLSSVSWSWPVIGQTPGNAGVSASPQPWPQAWWWRQSCQLITSHPWDMGEHSVLCHKARSENSWRMLLLCQLTAETNW